ncbi:hypothetical protein D3C75_741310 [compost metagenome]
MRLDLPGGVALGVVDDPALEFLDHRGRRHHRTAEARNVARHAGVAEGAVHAQLEPGHARLLVVDPVPRLHDHREVRRAAAVEQVEHAVGHAGVIAPGDVHRHAAVGHAHQQVTDQRHLGLDQRGGHLGQGGDHAFRVGGAEAEHPVVDHPRRGLHVGLGRLAGEDLLGLVALQVGIDGRIEQHAGSATAAAALGQHVAAGRAHRLVAGGQADRLQVAGHELAGRAGRAGRAVDVGQLEQQVLQALGVDARAGLLVPHHLLGRERHGNGRLHGEFLSGWPRTVR